MKKMKFALKLALKFVFLLLRVGERSSDSHIGRDVIF